MFFLIFPSVECILTFLQILTEIFYVIYLFQVTQLTAQLEDVVSSANEASDLMENEQMEKRELEEKLNETNVGNYVCMSPPPLPQSKSLLIDTSLNYSLLMHKLIHANTHKCIPRRLLYIKSALLFLCTRPPTCDHSLTESHTHTHS